MINDLDRFLPVEHGAGAVIQLSLDPLDFPSRDLVKLRAFRKVLPDQSIGVFIRASLPRRTGMREVDNDAGSSVNCLCPLISLP